MPDQTNLPTATIETSKKGSLSKLDAWRSTLTTLYVSVVTILLQFIDAAITALSTSGSLHFDWTNLLITLKIAVATWLGDSIRRLLKDSVTVIRVKPALPDVRVDDGDDPPPPPPPEGTEIPTKPPPTP